MAMTMLSCYAAETHDEGLLLCIAVVEINAADKIRVVPFDSGLFEGGQIAVTLSSCQNTMADPPEFLFKDDDYCNCILFNEDELDVDCNYGSDDEQAGAAMLAGLLMHEICHAKTLAGLTAPGNGWPCNLACNEVECYTVELAILCGLMKSGCVDLTAAGVEDIESRKDTIEENIELEEEKKQIMGCGSKVSVRRARPRCA